MPHFTNPAIELFWPLALFIVIASAVLFGIMIHNSRREYGDQRYLEGQTDLLRLDFMSPWDMAPIVMAEN